MDNDKKIINSSVKGALIGAGTGFVIALVMHWSIVWTTLGGAAIGGYFTAKGLDMANSLPKVKTT